MRAGLSPNGSKKPAGIRSLVYGMSKGKAGIESLSVSRTVNFDQEQANLILTQPPV